MFSPLEVEKKPEINALVSEVLKEFSPDVVRIRFNFGEDWTGTPTIFFRVLLSDEVAGALRNTRDIPRRVEDRLSDRIIPELGIIPHFNYRSQSEQAELRDPDWN